MCLRPFQPDKKYFTFKLQILPCLALFLHYYGYKTELDAYGIQTISMLTLFLHLHIFTVPIKKKTKTKT